MLSCIQRTLSGQIHYEVLIIDDASDGATHFIESLASTHRVFFNQKNKGFAKNNNFLARKAKGEYLCLLNSDAYVQGNWLFPMLDVFKQEFKGWFGGKCKSYTDRFHMIMPVWFSVLRVIHGIMVRFLIKPRGQSVRRYGYGCLCGC